MSLPQLQARSSAALGTVKPDLRAIAEQLGVPYYESLAQWPTSAAFTAKVPIAFARRHLVLGLTHATDTPEAQSGQTIFAIGDAGSWQHAEIVARFLGRADAKRVFAAPSVVLAAINEAYQQRTGQAQAAIERLDRRDVLEEVRQLTSGREDLLDVAGRAPVIRLINLMLFEAVQAGASDVHVQPYEERLVVRLRIDGVLHDAFDLPKNVQEEAIGRLKVMGRMNIAEKRLAQDGRATAQVGDRQVDLRIASLPTSFGERVVVRLLDKGARLYRLGELGMPATTHRQFRRLIGLEHGLVLVTGPTGSGKSTTLYAALKEIDAASHNVLTLEDPIEYQLDGISQTQVSDKKGMTFASGLRHVLRQDPDVIMVGEIRDRETAVMAIQSALTGHLVFSTLHTNDSASAVTRLLDLGIEPYLVASSLAGVLAQRLVRRVCPKCGENRAVRPTERPWFGPSIPQDARIISGTGCESCRHTGYRGRFGVFELLTVGERVRSLIQSRATAADIKTVAVESGMHTMRDDGAGKVLAGLTTIEEVERVTVRASVENVDAAGEPVEEDTLVAEVTG